MVNTPTRTPRKRARLLLATACVLALVGISSPAQAATYSGNGMANCAWNYYRSSGYNPTWTTPMAAAEPKWNVVPEVNIIRKSTTAGTVGNVYAGNYGFSWYGTALISSHTTFTIKLNADMITRDATNFANFVQSVYLHEFGHTLNLADDPTTSSSSIMKYSRNRNTMTYPQTFDKNAVAAWY